MIDSDNENKFKEELENEIKTGLHNTLDEGKGQDFTVKVRREEYIVKRRFYDKDKALETAQSLRKDKRNLVEDNLQGQKLSSESDDEEKVDWDKLVDAGLEFDPPIAHAADLKPGEGPVAFIRPEDRPEVEDSRELEKTFLVRKTPTIIKEEEKSEPVQPGPVDSSSEDDFDLEVEKEVDASLVEEPEEQAADSEEAVTVAPSDETGRPGRGRRRGVFWLVAAACLAALFYVIQGSDQTPQNIGQAPERNVIKPAEPLPEDRTTSGAIPGAVPSAIPDKTAVTETAEPGTVIPAGPENKISAGPQLPLPFTVHVSSYRLAAEADKAIAQLKGMGHAAFSGMVSIPGKGDWYRIYAGCFTNRDQAAALAGTIKSNLQEDAAALNAPWTIQVGSDAAPGDVNNLVADLESRSYRIYTLPALSRPDSLRILAGAFSSKKEASAMMNALTKDGFTVTLVKR